MIFFNLHVRHYRQLKKLTQQDLAEKIGVTQQYISDLESNNRNASPTLHIIGLISQALDVCPYQLVKFNCIELCKHHETCNYHSLVIEY